MRMSGLTGLVLTFLTVFRIISPVAAEEKLLTYQAMNMELALKIAQETMQACQN
ncbi:MAG: hypothetical protein ISR53_01320, partial [Rhodospirillales bacterium]|nr:hypothetical protein [Rhodospirillales bacterium]